MLKTIEASITEDGTVRLSEPVEVGRVRRAIVTILDEPPLNEADDADWNAWARAGAASLANAFPNDDFSDWEEPREPRPEAG